MSKVKEILELTSLLNPLEIRSLIMILIIRADDDELNLQLKNHLETVGMNFDTTTPEKKEKQVLKAMDRVNIIPLSEGRTLTQEELKELEERADVPFFEVQEEEDEEPEDQV